MARGACCKCGRQFKLEDSRWAVGLQSMCDACWSAGGWQAAKTWAAPLRAVCGRCGAIFEGRDGQALPTCDCWETMPDGRLQLRPQRRPCPWCGSRSVSVREGSTFRWVVAECDECSACGPPQRRDTMRERELPGFEIDDQDRQLALDAWDKQKGAG